MTSLRLRTAALTLAAFLLTAAVAGCFAPPTPAGPAVDPTDADLHGRVAAVVGGDDARLYAAFYQLIADRLTAGEWETTGELAAVAGRAATLLALPGRLSAIVEDELDPVLNPPGPLSGARRTDAAAAFARLADACGEAGR